MSLQAGDIAPDFETQDIFGNPIQLKDYAGKKIFVAFHRYAACPFCNLRTEQIIQYAPLWQSKGLAMIAFFQSPASSIVKNVGRQEPPYPVIGDPDRIIYNRYFVESDKMKAAATLPKTLIAGVMARLGSDKISGDGDDTLIPAEFLINPDLTIHTAYYGENIADHIPIKRIVEFVEN